MSKRTSRAYALHRRREGIAKLIGDMSAEGDLDRAWRTVFWKPRAGSMRRGLSTRTPWR